MSPVSMFDQDDNTQADTVEGSKRSGYLDGVATTNEPADDGTSSDDGRELTKLPTEYVNVRPAWYRVGRGLILVGVACFLALQVVREVRERFDSQLDPPGEPGEEVALIIPTGATTANIGRQLQQEEIVPNSTFFRYYAEWKDEGNFQAGEYLLQKNSSVQEAIDVLNLGPKPQIYQRFTVREGLWIDEMLPVIAEQIDGVTVSQLRTVLNTGQINPRYRPEGERSWEGLLFADTYEISEETDALEVLLKMSEEFTEVTGDLSYGTADTPLDLSAYEILIVASLIEAEARVAEERPLVASVIYNRLRERWVLGIDATCLYATGDRRAELTNDILHAEGPYNCRDNVGLPPTPINSPSRASLEAAINPAETVFMYYVLTDASGTHTFAETDEEFIIARDICREKGLC